METELEIVGNIDHVERIAVGSGIRELESLRKLFGEGRWRNLNGLANVRLPPATSGHAKCTGTKRMASASAS